MLPAQASFADSGTAAIGYGVLDEDNPSSSSAFLVTRGPAGAVSRASRVPRAQQILGLAYDGTALELLTGNSPAGQACCSSAQVTGYKKGSFQRPHTLVSQVGGAGTGALVPLPGQQLLAAVASEQGVWVAQADARGRFGPVHQLAARGSAPHVLAATALPDGNSTVAWTAAGSGPPDAGPDAILAASGTRKGAPRSRRTILGLGAGYEVDELGIAPGAAVPTLAWIESWFDAAGAFHSVPVVADLTRRVSPSVISSSGAASGLSIAGDRRGEQALAWQACAPDGTCTVNASVRRARGSFGAPRALGPVDGSQPPAVAVTSGGQAVVAWINGGQVFAAVRGARAAGFGAARRISDTTFAADVALGAGPSGRVLAAWTQGTLAPAVVGSLLTP